MKFLRGDSSKVWRCFGVFVVCLEVKASLQINLYSMLWLLILVHISLFNGLNVEEYIILIMFLVQIYCQKSCFLWFLNLKNFK